MSVVIEILSVSKSAVLGGRYSISRVALLNYCIRLIFAPKASICSDNLSIIGNPSLIFSSRSSKY